MPGNDAGVNSCVGEKARGAGGGGASGHVYLFSRPTLIEPGEDVARDLSAPPGTPTRGKNGMARVHPAAGATPANERRDSTPGRSVGGAWRRLLLQMYLRSLCRLRFPVGPDAPRGPVGTYEYVACRRYLRTDQDSTGTLTTARARARS